MTKRVANSNARRCVQNREEFKGSNTYAEWRGYIDPEYYVVYSYGEHWPLFIYEDGKWYENEDKRSVSTSKHRSQLHPLCETEKRSCNDMTAIADFGVAEWMRRKLAA